jgi:hypothetical protein
MAGDAREADFSLGFGLLDEFEPLGIVEAVGVVDGVVEENV